jgi:hypothetical protein
MMMMSLRATAPHPSTGGIEKKKKEWWAEYEKKGE